MDDNKDLDLQLLIISASFRLLVSTMTVMAEELSLRQGDLSRFIEESSATLATQLRDTEPMDTLIQVQLDLYKATWETIFPHLPKLKQVFMLLESEDLESLAPMWAHADGLSTPDTDGEQNE